MAKLTLEGFRRQFGSVIDQHDSFVVVYSGIWTFGHRFNFPTAQIPQLLIEAMLEEVGPNRTLLLPSYTYAYTRDRVFSPARSRPETGILPEIMLRYFPHVRTRSALNSFLAIGPRAMEISSIAGDTLWGEGSLKCFFQRQHARIVVLGLPWKDGCGFLHRIEEVCQVPYRYHKTFHGIWKEDDEVRPWSETMYVRPLDLLPIFQWNLIDEYLRERNRIASGGGEVHIESADAADIINAGMEILSGDKLALLTNREEIENWIRKGKAGEIENLRRAEPKALDHFDGAASMHKGLALGRGPTKSPTGYGS